MVRGAVRLLLLLAIMVNVSYLRGFQLQGVITSSYLLIPLLAMGFGIVVVGILKTKSVVFARRWWLWMTLTGWICVSFLYNVFWRPVPELTIQFTTELLLNIFLLVSVIFLLEKELLERLYRGFVGVSATAAVLLTAYPLISGFERVRRVGGYQIPGAVNNISQMIAVAIVIAIAGLICADDWRDRKFELVSLPLLFPALLLTGSRSAIIGLVLSLGLLSVFRGFATIRTVVLVVGGVASAFGVLAYFYELTGIYRFGIDSIAKAVNTRLFLYSESIRQAGFRVTDILFGGGMYRYGKIAGSEIQGIIYPHNYVISLYVHVGLPAALIFGTILLKNGRTLFALVFRDEDSVDYVTLSTLLAMVVVIMYSFTSGRVTRTFPLWIILGISEFLYASQTTGGTEQLQSEAQNLSQSSAPQ